MTEPEDEVARWALVFIGAAAGVPVPLYGSEEWLKAHGLLRLASAVRAAEAWRREGDAHVLAAQLDVEVEAARRHDERDYDEWRAIAQRVRASVNWPTHAELQIRRGVTG